MSDSEIINETLDMSIEDLPAARSRRSSYFQDVVDSSYVGISEVSLDDSVINKTKKKVGVINSTSSEDEPDFSNMPATESSLRDPEVDSTHMSVDQSTQSYRDMSISAVSSRSASLEEIFNISSDDEDDLFVDISNTESPGNAKQRIHQQLKLRPSILSPQLLPIDSNGTPKVFASNDVQHSTPIKQFEKQIENKKCMVEPKVSPDKIQHPHWNIQKPHFDSIKPKILATIQDTAIPPVEVSQSQYLQQKEVIQKLNFDIMRTRSMMSSLDVDRLPDKGDALNKRLFNLRKDLQDGEELLKNMVVVAGSKPFKQVAWENLETELGRVQPKTFGKQALQTLNFQKSLTLNTLQEIHGSLNTCPSEDTYATDPQGIKVELMPHQKHALAWLTWRENQKPSGGILADDMGLGKTLTMLSLILTCNQRSKENEAPDNGKVHGMYPGGTLVICPASLIYQWEAEIKKHVRRGLLSVTLQHGNHREEKTKRLAKQDIVITTYSLAMRDHNKSGPMFGIKWHRIILDEAHQIRNYKSLTSVAVCALNAKSRWALTGTPVHNKELDLYALIKFLKCAPFDDVAVWRRWVANKGAGGQDRLNTVLSSLILRRTKQQLAEKKLLTNLPEKEWQLVEVRLDKEEMQVYQKVLIFSRTLFAQFLHQRAEKDSANLPQSELMNNPNPEYFKMHARLTKMNRVKPIKQHEILVLLLRLRQICCHPSLITGMLQGEEKVSDVEDEECEEMNILDQLNKLDIQQEEPLENVADGISNDDRVGLAEATRNILNPSHPIFAENRQSSKIKKVLSILEAILSKNEKVIIISQWTKLLNLMAIHLKKEGIQYYQLDGSVPVSKRMEIVNNINKQSHYIKVLLLSLTAGGVGLNLVGANNLLLIDLHWNPQLEMQAQDRIYRVGQTKPVKIYKLITSDTIEQRIKQLQDKKLLLAEELLTGTKIQDLNKLTLDDLKMLFSI